MSERNSLIESENQKLIENSKRILDEFHEKSQPLNDFFKKYAGNGVILGLNVTSINGCWSINNLTLDIENTINLKE